MFKRVRPTYLRLGLISLILAMGYFEGFETGEFLVGGRGRNLSYG